MTHPLLAVATHRLAGARVAPFDPAPLSAVEWDTLTAAAAANGVRGLLADAVDRGSLQSTAEQRDESASTHIGVMTGCLALESVLLDILDVLASRGVEALVIHGIPAAHLDYPDPAWRPFGDVDLLVRASDLAEARASLGDAGLLPLTGNPDRLLDGTGRQVELHTHVLHQRWARHAPESELWRKPAGMTLAGRTVPVLAPEQRLVGACLARALAGRRLIAVRDLVQQVLGTGDPAGVLEVARRWQVSAGVAAAIDDAWDRFSVADVVRLSVWAARNHPQAQLLRARAPRGTLNRRWLVRG